MKLVLLWSLMNWGNWSLSKFDRPQKLAIIFWGNGDFFKRQFSSIRVAFFTFFSDYDVSDFSLKATRKTLILFKVDITYFKLDDFHQNSICFLEFS